MPYAGKLNSLESMAWMYKGFLRLSLNCYMFRRDSKYGIDSTLVHKTKNFRMPVQKDRHGNYKVPSDTTIYTCFTSDFFHKDADEWRPEAWEMMRERSDCHFDYSDALKAPVRKAGNHLSGQSEIEIL